MASEIFVSGELADVKKCTSPAGFTLWLHGADGQTYRIFAPLTQSPFLKNAAKARMSLKRFGQLQGIDWISTQILVDDASEESFEF